MREASIVKGLLWQASLSVFEELFEDLESLRKSPDDADTWEDTHIIGLLPPRFTGRCDTRFARMFLVAMLDVTARLAHGWEYPATVAHELAAQILLTQATVFEGTLENAFDFEWRDHLEEVILKIATSSCSMNRAWTGSKPTQHPNSA